MNDSFWPVSADHLRSFKVAAALGVEATHQANAKAGNWFWPSCIPRREGNPGSGPTGVARSYIRPAGLLKRQYLAAHGYGFLITLAYEEMMKALLYQQLIRPPAGITDDRSTFAGLASIRRKHHLTGLVFVYKRPAPAELRSDFLSSQSKSFGRLLALFTGHFASFRSPICPDRIHPLVVESFQFDQLIEGQFGSIDSAAVFITRLGHMPSPTAL